MPAFKFFSKKNKQTHPLNDDPLINFHHFYTDSYSIPTNTASNPTTFYSLPEYIPSSVSTNPKEEKHSARTAYTNIKRLLKRFPNSLSTYFSFEKKSTIQKPNVQCDPLFPSTHQVETSSLENSTSFTPTFPRLSEVKEVTASNTFPEHPPSPPLNTSITQAKQIPLTTSIPAQPSPILLPSPVSESTYKKKCLVLDLDETLIHASFESMMDANFVLSIGLDGIHRNVYVRKRPFLDEFLHFVSSRFEVVIFTASVAEYADPVISAFDKNCVVRRRLFRDSCTYYQGNYVKNLHFVHHDLSNVIMIDNCQTSYLFNQENAIPISTWFNDQEDTELKDLVPFLEDLETADNAVSLLKNYHKR